MMNYILITGAGGGMGKSVSRLLASEGYTVFAMDRQAPEFGEDNNIIPLCADIRSSEEIRAAFETVRQHTDSLFAIIHFAGMYMLDSLVEIEDEEYERAFDVNTLGAFRVNKHFLPLLGEGSRIIITTSELAPLDPLPFTGVYAITKAALDRYAYSLRMELQIKGIEVSVLRAGAVATSMIGASTEALNRFIDKTSLYSVNARKFRDIVDSVEAKAIAPEKLAKKVLDILKKKHPKFAYSINRNPLLRLLNILPMSLRFYIIRKILA